MSYSANQYNYATPLSSSKRLVGKTFAGAQMLDFDTWLENVASVGVTRGTYSVDNLGKIISITAAENDAFTPYLADNAFRIKAKPNTQYTLSYRRSGDPGRVFLFDSGATDNMVQSDANVTSAALTLTTSANTSFITFRLGSSTTGGTATYSEIMLNEGGTALLYEEYNAEQAYPNTTKFFTLYDNVLDGSYYPITGDAGLWGNVLSDASGNLSAPFVVSNTEWLTFNAFRLVGASDNYPVAFTVQFYTDSTLVYTITETNNNKAEYIHYLPSSIHVSGVVVTVTKISKANAVAQLLNIYNLPHVKRMDTLNSKVTEASEMHMFLSLLRTDTVGVKQEQSRNMSVKVDSADNVKVRTTEAVKHILSNIVASDTVKQKTSGKTVILNTFDKKLDTLRIKQTDSDYILNTIDVTSDRLLLKHIEHISHVLNTIDITYDTLQAKNESIATPTNIHTVMKSPSRRVYGKVEITYIDPMLDHEVTTEATSVAYNSSIDQLFDGVYESEHKYFTLYDNDLAGNYVLSNESSQTGWVSAEVSNENGLFEEPVGFVISFSNRPIVSFKVVFDNSRDNLVKDFKLIFIKNDGNSIELDYTDNNDVVIDAQVNIPDVVSVQLLITRVARANAPAVVYSIPLLSNVLYKGYENESQLISVDLLEELSYEDEVEMLGGVSANEITVVLDNSNRDFFFNSGSIVADQLKRNRKIVPWLGAEIIPGVIEWYTLGTFWSYKWEVPVNGLTATVIGFDTLGLLGNTPYLNHHTQINKSIGYLLEYILEDARNTLQFIEYVIDEALYDVIIPYAWFDNSNHAAALRKLSLCYPMHIYCDRQGRICAAPQKLHLDYYYDIWSGSTNIIDTNYSSLYTALPNIINVAVYNPVTLYDEKLAESDTPFTVSDMNSNVLKFSKPYLSDIEISVDCDDTVSYNYEVYSWGAVINFTGSGIVNNITCLGTCIDVSSSSVVSKQDSERIKYDGAISRDVDSQFIQTISLANMLLNRFFELLETDKYDATVDYRGDIALAINDPIVLQESIAPDNRYNIKRHQLSWNGALTGSADLNT